MTEGAACVPELVGVSEMSEHFTSAHELEHHEQISVVLHRTAVQRYGLALAISRSPVQIPLEATLRSNLGQVVYT